MGAWAELARKGLSNPALPNQLSATTRIGASANTLATVPIIRTAWANLV